ncbi:MAG TPA: glycerophosphodiester phosphodiesterase [Vulgatibacter sp.]|nr:glycerophosphodiester phosphodiesterase [Vulgatibacter sp.]
MRAGYHDSRFRREDRPLVYAHRGASAARPENTCPAFERAAADGADGIECDVRFCGSGELVVCHDARLDRLAGVPSAVAELPLRELRAIPILAERFPGAAATVPTLEEAVECGGPGMVWNLEIKVDRHHDAEPLARALASAIPRLPLEGRVLVSSFHPLALLTLRKVAPRIPTAWLWERGGTGQRAWAAFWGRLCATHALHPDAAMVRAEDVRAWHRRGLLVNVWTVDDPEEIRRLRSWGVDGVITNRPAETLRILEGG